MRTVSVVIGWLALCAWCVSGTPPCVDLPAHAAQLQTLADVLRDVPYTRGVYWVHFVPGYGLSTWLFVPVAMLANGAVAAKLALWVSIGSFLPLVGYALWAMGKRLELALFAAPICFSFSYWYGFLPELFARSLAVLAFAVWMHARRKPRLLLLAAGLFVVTALAHLLTFALLMVVVVPMARKKWAALVPALLTAAIAVVRLRSPVAQSGGFRWDLSGHLLFFLRNYTGEGRVGLVGFLLAMGVILAVGERRRLGPVLLLTGVYFLCPRDAGVASILCYRIPSVIALATVFMAEPLLEKPVLLGLAAAGLLLSLGQALLFHERFRADETLQTRIPYRSHSLDWVIARNGGGGTGFFEDAPQQPVQRPK